MIHPVFHVSQLQKRLGTDKATSPHLPLVGSDGKFRVDPAAILDRRMVKRRNAPVPQIQVRRTNLADEEDYDQIRAQFPKC